MTSMFLGGIPAGEATSAAKSLQGFPTVTVPTDIRPAPSVVACTASACVRAPTSTHTCFTTATATATAAAEAAEAAKVVAGVAAAVQSGAVMHDARHRRPATGCRYDG